MSYIVPNELINKPRPIKQNLGTSQLISPPSFKLAYKSKNPSRRNFILLLRREKTTDHTSLTTKTEILFENAASFLAENDKVQVII